jgi:hypothetical protein
VITQARLARYRDVLPELLSEAHEQFTMARAAVSGQADMREADFSELEAAGNRLLELQRAAREGADLRICPETLLPSRSAALDDFIVPTLDEAELSRGLVQARVTEQAYTAALQEHYGYNLIGRNCVSEIFREINRGLEPDAPGAPADQAVTRTDLDESTRHASSVRLGGYIEPGEHLSFIPFVSADAVNDAYHVAEREEVVPYRRVRLTEMYASEDPFWVYLRESSTLTSTVYRRGRDDSVFVFFTDDAGLLRPLFGAINVTAGLVASVVGLIALPFDGSATLTAGLKGALFSAPELAFFNVRKGSFDFVPRKYRERATVVASAPGSGAHLHP